jgi:hypothetical protein
VFKIFNFRCGLWNLILSSGLGDEDVDTVDVDGDADAVSIDEMVAG